MEFKKWLEYEYGMQMKRQPEAGKAMAPGYGVNAINKIGNAVTGKFDALMGGGFSPTQQNLASAAYKMMSKGTKDDQLEQNIWNKQATRATATAMMTNKDGQPRTDKAGAVVDIEAAVQEAYIKYVRETLTPVNAAVATSIINKPYTDFEIRKHRTKDQYGNINCTFAIPNAPIK